RLVWIDRSGKQFASLDSPGYCQGINLSPDEKRVAIDVVNFEVGGGGDLQGEVARGGASRVTPGGKPKWGAVWSPDGSRIALASGPTTDELDLYEEPSGGVGKEELLFHSAGSKVPVDWSRDGRFLLFELRESGATSKLCLLPVTGDRTPFPLLKTSFSES